MEQIENLQEEIFCLQFELNTMSDLLIRGEAERWVHKFIHYNYEAEHLNRYKLVKSYVENKKVLDIACGSGFGSYTMAFEGKAAEVVGCDLSPISIRYAKHRYKQDNLNFFVEDAERFRKSNYFDVIVSFETIEHLNNYESFLKNIQESLVDSGLLFISTPITLTTTTNCGNPYHRIEWSFEGFQELIKKYFLIDKVYIQNISMSQSSNIVARGLRKAGRILLNSPSSHSPTYDLNLFDATKHKGKISSGYQVLVCRKSKR